jgi:hypothetical protein
LRRPSPAPRVPFLPASDNRPPRLFFLVVAMSKSLERRARTLRRTANRVPGLTSAGRVSGNRPSQARIAVRLQSVNPRWRQVLQEKGSGRQIMDVLVWLGEWLAWSSIDRYLS